MRVYFEIVVHCIFGVSMINAVDNVANQFLFKKMYEYL